MLNHSFVLDALDTTAADTFSHFEMLIDEHRLHYQNETGSDSDKVPVGPSRLKQLVPTVGTFHTHLPLRKAFVAYNKKYSLTKRKFITISFNELRHILNLAQIMALRGGRVGKGGEPRADLEDQQILSKTLKQWANSPGALCQGMGGLVPPVLPPEISLGSAAVAEGNEKMVMANSSGISLESAAAVTQGASTSALVSASASAGDFVIDIDKNVFKGPKMITFDGDQTLYSDGANFEGNPQLANYLYLLLRHGVTLAVVTAAGYEYNTERYEMRLSGLLAYFKAKNLAAEDCERFYLFGGECNFLLKVSSVRGVVCMYFTWQHYTFVPCERFALFDFDSFIRSTYLYFQNRKTARVRLQITPCERIRSRGVENSHEIHPRLARKLGRRQHPITPRHL